MRNILGVRDEKRKKTLMFFDGSKSVVSTDLLQTQPFKTYLIKEESPIAKYTLAPMEGEKVKLAFLSALSEKLSDISPIEVTDFKKENNCTAFHDHYMVENGLYNNIQNMLNDIAKYGKSFEDSEFFKFFTILTSKVRDSFNIYLYYQERDTFLEVVWFEGHSFSWKDRINVGFRDSSMIKAVVLDLYSKTKGHCNFCQNFTLVPALCFSKARACCDYNKTMTDATIYYACNNTDFIKETDNEELASAVRENIGDFIL